MQTIGPDGLRYLPFLVTLFFFILICNIFEVIPFFHMPANARMANPPILALITWVIFIGVGIKHQGREVLLKAVALPAGRAEGALPPGDADRVHLDLPRPALLASPSVSSPTCSPATSCS